MMIKLTEVGPPLNQEALARLERNLGASLPDPYRRFLIRTNGGVPAPGMHTVDVEGLPGGAADVHEFFELTDSAESYDLRARRETLCDRIPANLLAIAKDSGGSVFCISLLGADRGAVSYCDLQSVYANFEADPEFYPVAPDFDAFLNKLREFPDQRVEGCIVPTNAGNEN